MGGSGRSVKIISLLDAYEMQTISGHFTFMPSFRQYITVIDRLMRKT